MEVHLPTTDAWALAEELRSRDRMANVPSSFMADESPGLKPGASFRSGVDHLLTKPFTIIDLHCAVEKASGIAHARRATRAPPRSSFEVAVRAPPCRPTRNAHHAAAERFVGRWKGWNQRFAARWPALVFRACSWSSNWSACRHGGLAWPEQHGTCGHSSRTHYRARIEGGQETRGRPCHLQDASVGEWHLRI